ncbi:hypothetical protein Y032_0238g3280 [Ancylostoma ceylanicum]|nr:hypothetical protein Y032_0238g3280 [Ancylostoma ceylanicum]
MEMKMLRWEVGVTRFDRICDRDIRQRFAIVPTADKLRDSQLRWYGHIFRADDDTICRIAFDEPGKRSKGRPKQHWLDALYAGCRVQAVAGTSAEFVISVGVHQGSALLPLLFLVVMDTNSRDLHRTIAWALLYADDVMLVSEAKEGARATDTGLERTSSPVRSSAVGQKD